MGKIGIDLTFISMDEIRAGRLTRSIEILTSELLDSFAEKGIQDQFVLIVHPIAKEFEVLYIK